MSDLKKQLLDIYRNNKSLLVLMGLLFLFSVFVMIYAIVGIDPNSAVVKIGYGDIGGYRDGSWFNMLTFPVLAVVFGVLHNFLAIKIYEKQGGGVAKVFLAVSILLVVGMFIVLIRLLGES